MFRPSKRKQERHGNRFNFGAPEFVYQFMDCIVGQWFQHFAVGCDSLPDAESQLCRNRRRRLYRIQIVEFGSRLASDLDHVFEAGRGYQGGARSATLQQGISSYRCAMHNFNFTRLVTVIFNDSLQARDDGARRIVGSGGQLENVQPIFGFENKIGEGPSGVHADAQGAKFAGYVIHAFDGELV